VEVTQTFIFKSRVTEKFEKNDVTKHFTKY
jgi:hypothetical protein